MKNNKLQAFKGENGDTFWNIETKVAGKTKIVSASSEGFSRAAKAKKNFLATRKRMNALTDAEINAAFSNVK